MDSKEPEGFSWIDNPSIVVRHYGSIAVYNEARSVAWLLRQTCQKRHSDTKTDSDLSGRPVWAQWNLLVFAKHRLGIFGLGPGDDQQESCSESSKG